MCYYFSNNYHFMPGQCLSVRLASESHCAQLRCLAREESKYKATTWSMYHSRNKTSVGTKVRHTTTNNFRSRCDSQAKATQHEEVFIRERKLSHATNNQLYGFSWSNLPLHRYSRMWMLCCASVAAHCRQIFSFFFCCLFCYDQRLFAHTNRIIRLVESEDGGGYLFLAHKNDYICGWLMWLVNRQRASGVFSYLFNFMFALTDNAPATSLCVSAGLASSIFAIAGTASTLIRIILAKVCCIAPCTSASQHKHWM